MGPSWNRCSGGDLHRPGADLGLLDLLDPDVFLAVVPCGLHSSSVSRRNVRPTFALHGRRERGRGDDGIDA
jgi:hypothetical protein